MYKRAPEKKRVFVTVEWPDGKVQIRLWKGWKVASIKEAAKKAYPGAFLQFGVWF